MKRQIKTTVNAILATALVAVGIAAMNLPVRALASGGSGSGGGGGGGGTQSATFSGNWTGTITTSFGTGAFTMGLSQSSTSVSGSAHFGAPIFDSTRKITATLLGATQFSGLVLNGEANAPITGTLSADGTTITGTVTQGETYTYIIKRN